MPAGVPTAWAGPDRATGEAVINRLQAACPQDVAVLEQTRLRAFQSAFDTAMPKGVRAYWRNASFDRFDGQMIDTLVERCAAQDWVGTAADIHHLGGAFGRVAEDATAFPNRAAQFWLNIYGFWPDPADDPARIGWIKGFSDAMGQYAMAGQYVNFLGHDDADPLSRAPLQSSEPGPAGAEWTGAEPRHGASCGAGRATEHETVRANGPLTESALTLC